MRAKLLHALIVTMVAAAGAAASASANCKDEVDAAFERQRKASGFRMQTKMIGEQGPIDMTVDYVLPDRMHQKVKVAISPDLLETIVIGDKGWAKSGAAWEALPQVDVHEAAEQMKQTVVAPPKEKGEYTCLGKVEFEGRQALGYRTDDPAGTKVKAGDGPFRIVYVDPTTGLPLRSAMATPSRPNAPFFKTDYSYPAGLVIEPPAKTN